MNGAPTVRSDIVDAYIFRRRAHDHANPIEFLQLQRANDPMRHTWQPVMGHIEPDETALITALREVEEETALARTSDGFIALWALERIAPYFLAESNCIVLSPRFAIEAAPTWEPTLNDEHSAHRWIAYPTHDDHPTASHFVWPSQASAIEEIAHHIANPDAPASALLRIDS